MEPPSQGLYHSFEHIVQAHENNTALIYLGEEFTYAGLRRYVLSLAAALHDMGVKPGDSVILYLYNLPQTIIAWLALQRLEAMVVPVAPVYSAYDLKYLALDCGAETIFCMDSNFNYVDEIIPHTPLKRIIYTNMLDMVPWWKRAIARGLERVPVGRSPQGDQVHSFNEVLKQGNPDHLPSLGPANPENTALILYTGGTTGFPKGVPLSSGLFLNNVREWRRASLAVVPHGQAISALCAPFYHVIGQMDATAPLLVGGESLIVLPRVILDGLLHEIQRHRATNMFAVPALYRMILEHDRLDQYDLSSLRYCGVGGDALPIEVGRRWLERFGVPLYQGYGATEFCGAITLSYAEFGTPPEGSIGRITTGSKVKLVDPDTLLPVAQGQPGELLGLMPWGVKGYRNKPEETESAFLEIDGEIWYRTNDIVREDPSGWLYFEDRSADMIKHKGYRVAAAEVERVLQEHHAVVAACVVGIPDEKVGERIKAFVIPKQDVRGLSSFELINWCRERLAPYKVPHYIEFRDILPRSKVGKMLRREMRAEEQRKRSA
ncbi:MAG: AMP-binding protein [Desulfomonile sp.]|nr:AMP-binding protein [Desulfomonile sp.]